MKIKISNKMKKDTMNNMFIVIIIFGILTLSIFLKKIGEFLVLNVLPDSNITEDGYWVIGILGVGFVCFCVVMILQWIIYLKNNITIEK